MNRFTRLQRDVREDQMYRDALLARPPEFFRTYFGVEPDMMQKLRFVEQVIQNVSSACVFANDVYAVRVRNAAPFVQLEIFRHDGAPRTNWRDFQQIKNELVGPECEAVELYPAESRLVDTANQYHLWVNPNPAYRFPVGYDRRLVLDEPVEYRGRAGEEAPRSAGRPLTGDNTATARPVGNPS